jgi:MFS family permease
MANGTFGTLAPVYGYERGLDAAGIAFVFSVTAILGALAQIPAGRLSDRIDRRMVMIVLAAVAAVAGLLIVLVNQGPGAAMYVLFGIYGFSAYPIYAIAVAHANDFAREGDFAKVAGGMLLTLGVGLAIGPAVASLVMNAWQPVGLFVITATFHGALAITALLRMRVRPAREASVREPFQPMATDKAATPESVVLDPRADEEPRPLTARPEEEEDVQVGA